MAAGRESETLAASQINVEEAIKISMEIFCDDLEARLLTLSMTSASLGDKFENSLLTSCENQGFNLRRPGSIRDLVDITSQLPIENPFQKLLKCIVECLPEALQILRLLDDAWKLGQLRLAVKDSLIDVAARSEPFCSFLTDMGALEICSYATDVHRFLKYLMVTIPDAWYEKVILAAVYSDCNDLLATIAPFGNEFKAELPKLRDQLNHLISEPEFGQAENCVSSWVKLFNRVRLDPASLRPTLKDPPPPQGEDQAENAAIGGCQLRDYQEELAQPALKGRNSIVIAPTGSGKTRVAVHVTLATLEAEPQAKVAFLVPTTNLVVQQFQEFQRCLPPRWRERVCHIHGGGDDQARMPFSQAMSDEFSVLVVSTQILVNELNRPAGRGIDGLAGDIARFRLVIFDECHSCVDNHPSRQVMLHYMRMKHKPQQGKRLPQILGLTASPGTGKASRLEEAVDHLVKLCASLDCTHPVTVQRCLESLLSVSSVPESSLHRVASKQCDQFNRLLNQLMERGENLWTAYREQLQSCETEGLPTIVPPRGTPSYVNFCSNIKFNMHMADNATGKNLYACSRYLGSSNKAQMISRFFRSVDGLLYLEKQLRSQDEMEKPPACEAEATLRQCLDSLMPTLLHFCDSEEAMASPPLEKLVDILREQFAREPKSRAIVFVQEKFYAQVLADFLTKASGLRLVATHVTGATSAEAAGGTNAAEQQAKLQDFRAGKIKVIVCTSVTEEGLDIPACNLVVRYCHVTNEISMVQTKGRVRAKDSSYHVIIDDSQEWLHGKECVNQRRDQMMREAVQHVTSMAAAELQDAMELFQSQWLAKADASAATKAAANAEAARESARSDAHDIICGKCRTLLTHSSRLRLIEDIHRVALDAALFKDRVRGQRANDARQLPGRFEKLGVDLVCAACGFQVAKVARHNKTYFAMISIEGVLFRQTVTGDIERAARQWKKTDAFLKVQKLSWEDKRWWSREMPRMPDELIGMI